jgi:hypothetical protein
MTITVLVPIAEWTRVNTFAPVFLKTFDNFGSFGGKSVSNNSDLAMKALNIVALLAP